MKKINQNRNKVVNEIDELLNEKQNLTLEYKKLQRTRDLKVDTVNQYYSDRIDRVLRKTEAIDLLIDQAKKYAKNNLRTGGNQDE